MARCYNSGSILFWYTNLMKSICVYCGSSDKIGGIYLNAAYELGAELAAQTFQLVYGAGSTGLMGAVANGVLENGGEVIGVIPELFNTPTLAHNGLTQLEVVPNMHQRKARMAELSDAFIALPGGFGTMEELFEMLTWAQIGLHQKPIGVLNVKNYFNPLLEMIEKANQEGFIYSEHRALFISAEDPRALVQALSDHEPPQGLERWLTRKG
jgi:uncharacterized protein (TIGR00730 family)